VPSPGFTVLAQERTQHGLHQPQVVSFYLAASQVLGHQTLIVHANQQLHVSRWSRQPLSVATGLRKSLLNVGWHVRGLQCHDPAHGYSLHNPHLVVSVYNRHHIVAVYHRAPAAQPCYHRGGLPHPLQSCFLGNGVCHEGDCRSPVVEGVQAASLECDLHSHVLLSQVNLCLSVAGPLHDHDVALHKSAVQ
jgi:hypothetical protein